MAEPSATAAVLDSLIDNLKNLQPSSSSSFASSSHRLHRPKSIHGLLGGGNSADVLLWRKKHISASFLCGASLVWILFEWVECHVVSLLSLLMLITLMLLFIWAHAASFLQRPPPPLPRLEVSDEVLLNLARSGRAEINRILAVLYDIALGKDMGLFFKVVFGLGLLFIVGGWFHFLTLIYIGVVAAHTIPVIYEQHGDNLGTYAQKAFDELNKHYRSFDSTMLSKIPRSPLKRKKSE